MRKARSLHWQKTRNRFAILLVFFVLIAGFCWYQTLPFSSERRRVKVKIAPGASTEKIAETLEQKKVLRSSLALQAYCIYRYGLTEGSKLKISSADHAFSPDMTLSQIVQELRHGDRNAKQIKVVIPEGFTLKQIAARLEKSGVVSSKEFLELAEHPEKLLWEEDFPTPPTTLEGYLFPDTYHFSAKTPPEQILHEMMTNFSTRFYKPFQNAIGASGRDLNSIVTMASLIEREAEIQEDRPRISGVIENRLAKDMRLEIDASVLYALGHHKNRVFFKDLEVDSPYNTYRNKGLPPGAIANPGLDSLKAALSPEKHDFLYYVARPNGSHLFTKTEAEHNRAVIQMKKARQSQNGGEETPGG